MAECRTSQLHNSLGQLINLLLFINLSMHPSYLFCFSGEPGLIQLLLSSHSGTPWTAELQAPLSSSISWSLLKLMSTESVILFNHLILCHRFLLLPSVFPSIRIFSSELALRIRWPKYWSFAISPSWSPVFLVAKSASNPPGG